MKIIHAKTITQEVAKLCIDACIELPKDVTKAFSLAYHQERSPLGKEILSSLITNAKIAKEKRIPLCQDTGMCVVFVELGENVRIEGGSLQDAINAGIAKGYTEGYLRKSVVSDPLFERKNTQDNTPAVIHLELTQGENLKITVAPKGFGSENKSQLQMLTPAQGISGLKKFFMQVVENAGPNSCPPLYVGVGIGGTMEYCAFLAKKALMRPIGSSNPNPKYAQLEKELKSMANALGIGPQGLGGSTTAFEVSVEYFPTHIAGLPVAININCNASRHQSITL